MAPITAPCPVDLADALARAGDDRDFYHELLQMFMDDAPARLEELERAIGQRDHATITAVAHSLKGAAANLSATGVREAAYSLETKGRAGETEGYDDPFRSLREELARLGEFVAGF